MSDIQSSFRRYEKKYLLTPSQYRAMIKGIAPHMEADRFSRYTICNVYYDTHDFQLIRKSLMKPLYKEKLRVRSYGPVSNSDPVFVELKKKYDGVVYKRRIIASAYEAERWLKGGQAPESSQIQQEIDWFRRLYPLSPKVFIGYDRQAFAGRQEGELRITFDTDLRWRDQDIDLRRGDHGYLLLPEETVLMEIKIPGTAPLWLARLLSENHVFSSSFSKYGAFYKQAVLAGKRGKAYFKEVAQSA